MRLRRWHARIRSRDHLGTILRVGVSAALLGFVVTSVGVDRVATNLAELRPTVLGIALLLAIVNIAISTYKWQVLLAAKGIELPFSTLFRLYYVGQFFNAFLPTAMGGDGVRAYYLNEEHEAGADAVSSVVLERLTGLVTILVLGGTATLLFMEQVPRAAAAAILLVSLPGTVLLLGLLFTDRGRSLFRWTLFRVERFGLGDRIAAGYDAIHEYRDARGALVPVLVASLLFRLVLVANHYVVAIGLGMDVPLVYFLVFVPLVEVLLLLPVSIQGFGVRETAYVYLFGAVGAEAGVALVLGVLMQLVLGVFNNVLGGVVYLLGGHSAR